MKKWSMKIGTQMGIGFAIVLALVLTLGIVSYFQTQMLYEEAQALYDHPLQVRQAVSQLKVDILNTRVGIRDLVLEEDDAVKEEAARIIQASLEDGEAQFDIFYSKYLGPMTDVDSAYEAYNDWRGASEYRAGLAQHGLLNGENIGDDSTVSGYREILMDKIQVIERFAANKAEELHTSFITLQNAINTQLFILCAAVIAATLIINTMLTRGIRRPLNELNNSITRFHQGNLGARSAYDKNNEFGTLTDSFNTMADSIQGNILLHQKTGNISKTMLSTENAHEFFQKTLAELADQSNAQMAAAYLYNPDKRVFEYFESIGLSGDAKATFDAAGLEGVFGASVLSGKIQIIKDIPQDTPYVAESPCCRFIPREIMTIPIFSGRQMLALLSLASLSAFKEGTIKLIEDILDTMSARIEGVLAYRTIQQFSALMEEKNRELDAQKDELGAQAGELTRQNTELEVQKEKLEEASRLKTSFLSNMSHELRTPLNSIIALSGVLGRRLSKKIPEEEYGYLEVIERNGKGLLNMINEILDISRIEAGREEVEISEFSVRELVLEVVLNIRPQADQKGIELLADPQNPDIRITSDAEKLRHVLQNLIGNAVKFTEKGQVVVALTGQQDSLVLEVSDTGVGIAAEHLPHIFEEFRQADAGTARRFGGTGLGLSIAKRYTELLGGTILVSSRIGKGSTFKVTLPMRYEGPLPAEEEKWEQDEEEKTGGFFKDDRENAGKTLLLIEDSQPAIIQIEDLFRETGHRLLIARSAVQAFEVLETEHPDAIILDLMMPDVDGFEILKSLRERHDTMATPVLILTAKHITQGDLASLKKNHIYQLIRKGDVDREELLRTISAMLRSRDQKTSIRQEKEERPLILVVEDNPDNMLTVKALLSEKYRVIGAIDGVEGTKAAKEHIPDLILMDIEMPRMNGVEAFMDIRKDPLLEHVPVIALTASVMQEEKETILGYGFDAFVSKPIETQEFYKVIGEVLYGR
jgi:signal transduction histidine kinase/CheY-like chemotaxis protein